MMNLAAIYDADGNVDHTTTIDHGNCTLRVQAAPGLVSLTVAGHSFRPGWAFANAWDADDMRTFGHALIAAADLVGVLAATKDRADGLPGLRPCERRA